MITIYNMGVLASGLLIVISGLVGYRDSNTARFPRLWLVTVYLTGIFMVCLIVGATLRGWLPIFFVQGRGGTPIRQIVLGAGISLFGLTTLIMSRAHDRTQQPFFFWCRNGMASISVGMFAALIQSGAGTPLSWCGRAAHYLGGVYFLFGAIAEVRRTGGLKISIAEALRHSQLRLQSFTRATFEGIVETSNGLIVDCNDQFARSLGRTVSEIKGTAIADLIAPEDKARSLAHIAESGEHLLETGLIRKDGKLVFAEIHGFPMPTGNGNRFTVVRDITERREMQDELRRARDELERRVDERTSELRKTEALYRGIFEGALEGIYRTTPAGKSLAVNRALAQLLGYESALEAIAAITDSAHQAWADPQERAAYVASLEANGFLRGYECRLRRKDGRQLHCRDQCIK